MKNSFYGHGKLLITSEYLIVDGAEGLALPCKKGQWLKISPIDQDVILWNSKDVNGEIWFEAEIASLNVQNKEDAFFEYSIIYSSDDQIAVSLVQLLISASELNPSFSPFGFSIETELEFDRDWGLGSSSTLISNLAQWFGIDPFELFFKTQKGSAYDIACASFNNPLIYSVHNQKPSITTIDFNPSFKNKLYFIHLGEKQISSSEVAKYSELSFDRNEKIKLINEITQKIIHAQTLIEFEDLITQHENHLSEILKRPTVKEERFPDYKGAIKSLGAWGGDFILVTERSNLKDYFRSKGYHTLIPYSDMVL